MKKYLAHVHTKPTHERRQLAMRYATLVTAVVFVGWLGMLGVRLAFSPSTTASTADNSSFAATVMGGMNSAAATLEVVSGAEAQQTQNPDTFGN